MITTGATARRIEQWEPSTSGVYYPGVTVRGVVGVDERSAVCLHLGDSVGDIDVEVFMRPHEVDDLIQNLRIVLGQMTPPSRGMCLND